MYTLLVLACLMKFLAHTVNKIVQDCFYMFNSDLDLCFQQNCSRLDSVHQVDEVLIKQLS